MIKVCVTLIIDLWTNKSGSDFIAIGASLMYNKFSREIIVLNMKRMTKSHTAEAIKESVEEIINDFDFDKSKINCKFEKIFKQFKVNKF